MKHKYIFPLLMGSVLSLSACSKNKKDAGAGATAPQGAQAQTPPPSGGVKDGPTPIKPSQAEPKSKQPPEGETNKSGQGTIQPPVASGQPKAPAPTRKDKKSIPFEEDESSPKTDKSPIRVTESEEEEILPPVRREKEEPVRQPRLSKQEQGAVERQWFAPDTLDTPAESWLYYNINPLLKSFKKGGPRVESLQKKIRITLALGYFDGFHQQPLVYKDHQYGRHAAVDPFLRAVVDDTVQKKCESGDVLQLCDFELISTDSVQSLYQRAGEDGFIQELRVLSGAETVYYSKNIESSEQKARSRKAEEIFRKAFEDSDLVVYVGHSRYGGGPDFRPPRLKSGVFDKGSYQQRRDGAKLLFGALKNPRRKAQHFALMSCDSSEHFAHEILQASIRAGSHKGPVQLTTLQGDLRAEELLSAGFANIESFLRQGRLDHARSLLRSQPRVSDALMLNNN